MKVFYLSSTNMSSSTTCKISSQTKSFTKNCNCFY